jgi:F0F1-type ATP synthase assembly protein I
VNFFTRYVILFEPACWIMARVPDDDSGLFLQRSLKALQENLRRSGPAAAGSYALIGAILLLGGLGYALDAWLGTSPWFVLAGLLLGIAVGFYELALTVWRR